MRNDYDVAKSMLKTMRLLSEGKEQYKKTIREQSETLAPEAQNMKDDFLVINDVDVKLLSTDDSDMKLLDDQKNEISNIIDGFKSDVEQIVDFEPGFTISPDQIRLDGTLTDEDIKFVFIAGKEDGVYVNADMLKLDTETATTLDKLAKFQETFKTSMEPLISQRNSNI